MGGKVTAQYRREYYARNKERRTAQNLLWRERHPTAWEAAKKKATKNSNKRRSADPLLRLRNAVTTRISKAMRRKRASADLIGCTYQELRAKLEAQFLPGMTWENYGLWHVDHCIPLASATSEEEVARLCHHSNLQPLWASVNQSKGGRTGSCASGGRIAEQN